MYQTQKLSRRCFMMAFICILAILGILMAHLYFSDTQFYTTPNPLPPASQFIAPDAGEFTVAFVSDTATNNLVLEKIIDEIQTKTPQPAFILHLGDFVKNHMANYDWLMRKIRPHLMNIPLYVVPGNHDIDWHGKLDKSFYRRRAMGPGYYWFGYGDTLFIGIDTSDTLDAGQASWLADTLNKIRPMFKHCIIFGHKPPENVPNASGKKLDHKMDAQSARTFASIVCNRRIDAMFFGHVHYASSGAFCGIPMYTLPAAGQDPRLDINKYGYMTIKMGSHGPSDIEHHYIDFNGPTRQYFGAWLSNDTSNPKIRGVIKTLWIIAALMLITGTILKHIQPRS